ncbi:MAG: hypothetical protein V4534_06590 [Myxococcota bacterium]
MKHHFLGALLLLACNLSFAESVRDKSIAAAKTGDAAMFEQLISTQPGEIDKHVATYACEEGHVDILELIDLYDQKINPASCALAATRGNHENAVHWLYKKFGDKILGVGGDILVNRMVENTNLVLLNWFNLHFGLEDSRSESALVLAAKNDKGPNYAVFRWLLDHRFPLPLVTGGANAIRESRELMNILNSYSSKEPYRKELPRFKTGR